MLTEDQIKNALRAVKYPGYSRDIVSFGLIKDISVQEGRVAVAMQLTSANHEAARQIKIESEQALKGLSGVAAVQVEVHQPAAAPAGASTSAWGQQNRVPGINRVVAVASGKGGV
ncbi:MAG TPA: iron-sulfur cluster assembly protein, partial [Clostridia bacterium]|nr:iron-sulfur cluster assembly protein [Clostridia bacterium]